jgi:SAM-dependent methyltransferase
MVTEIRERFGTRLTATQADCQERLPYPAATFDRAIVVHVFEHLPNLPAAVAELCRVLKPGAIFSLVLPCDPGLLYEIARKVSAERLFRKWYHQSYRWLIRREHINSPREILGEVGKRFEEIERRYFPFYVPIMNANLCIGVTYRAR